VIPKLWKVYGDGRRPAPGAVVAPDERLSWARTAGLGVQHVIAMFGATFVFPLVMGLDPNLAVMMSGVATILFLLIVQGKVPSYLGTSASFVGGVFAIRAAGGGDAMVTGAILVAGFVLALAGLAIHFLGPQIIHKVFPPPVTGAVVMLIGFGLAFVVADVYWSQDPWVALITMVFIFVTMVSFRGFIGRISILMGLIFGFAPVLGPGPVRPDQLGTPGCEPAGRHGQALPNRGAVLHRHALRPLPRELRRRDGRQLVRSTGHARARLQDIGDSARDASDHRVDRGEHGARQSGRRDDRARSGPGDRPGHFR
jgi:hypothetical protein